MATDAATTGDGADAWTGPRVPPPRGPDPTDRRGRAGAHLVAVPSDRTASSDDVVPAGTALAQQARAGDDTELDDPADIAGALARCVAEVLSGARDLDTIARWITDDVHRHLLQRVALAARARSAARKPVGRPVFHVGGVVLDRPRSEVVEAAVVVHTRNRARAVSIRLEVHAGRWRATSIAVL